MATIYDVARRANVSTYTVSSVLNRTANVSPELTERVLAAVRDLDYTANELARSLPSRRTRTIGMLIPDIANPFYAKVVRGVQDTLGRNGYSLILGSTYNEPGEQARYLSLFKAKQSDGFVVFAASGPQDGLRNLSASGRPVVMVGRLPQGFEADSVTADNVLGGTLATRFLAGRGHKRIAILTGQMSLSASADRVLGWRTTLVEAGLGSPDEYIAEGDWTATSGSAWMHRLLKLAEPPTAVFISNFLMLTGALRALNELGLQCPRDVELVSSDDSDWLDVFQPAVTTVVTDTYAMGSRAAGLLLERIEDPTLEVRQVVLTPQLRVRAPGQAL